MSELLESQKEELAEYRNKNKIWLFTIAKDYKSFDEEVKFKIKSIYTSRLRSNLSKLEKQMLEEDRYTEEDKKQLQYIFSGRAYATKEGWLLRLFSTSVILIKGEKANEEVLYNIVEDSEGNVTFQKTLYTGYLEDYLPFKETVIEDVEEFNNVENYWFINFSTRYLQHLN